MDKFNDSEPIATTHWEAKSMTAFAYDPAYERALSAVRRWVESMEGTLNVSRPLAAAAARK
jgi:hypothetical protein